MANQISVSFPGGRRAVLDKAMELLLEENMSKFIQDSTYLECCRVLEQFQLSPVEVAKKAGF